MCECRAVFDWSVDIYLEVYISTQRRQTSNKKRNIGRKMQNKNKKGKKAKKVLKKMDLQLK